MGFKKYNTFNINDNVFGDNFIVYKFKEEN